jgi:endonuclease-3
VVITPPDKQNSSKYFREAPKDWKTIWDKIEEMRKENVAPVDTMGCSTLAENTSPEVKPYILTQKVYRYQTLISLMLSSQTKDPVTAQAMANLKKHGLTVDNILETEETKIDELISKVGFHKRKALYNTYDLINQIHQTNNKSTQR